MTNSIRRNISNPRYLASVFVKRGLAWLPDSIFLRLRFYMENGHRLDLSSPRTFQEKLQWLKLHRRRPEFTTMVDKYAVKDLVASKIGRQYVIPTLGVWERADDIDFDSLPDRFVLKTTHSGGNLGVLVCQDKATFDRTSARARLEKSLKNSIYKECREWPYKDVSRRIIAEEFISEPGKPDLTDYKIFCFNGHPRYIQVIQDRNSHESVDFFDTSWNHQDFCGLNHVVKPVEESTLYPSAKPIERPSGLEKMLELAAVLAAGTEFVRVDFYNAGDRVYFGELTFFPNSGYGTFTPSEWNERFGDMIELQR